MRTTYIIINLILGSMNDRDYESKDKKKKNKKKKIEEFSHMITA